MTDDAPQRNSKHFIVPVGFFFSFFFFSSWSPCAAKFMRVPHRKASISPMHNTGQHSSLTFAVVVRNITGGANQQKGVEVRNRKNVI